MKNSHPQISKRVFKDVGSLMASLNGFTFPLDFPPRTRNTQTLGKRDDWCQKLQYLDKHALVNWIAKNASWFFDFRGTNAEKYQACVDDPDTRFSRKYTTENLRYQWKKLEKEYKKRRSERKSTTGAGLMDDERTDDIENVDGISRW